MKDFKNTGKFYVHYLQPYWLEFLITTILIAISTWAIEELTVYVQQ